MCTTGSLLGTLPPSLLALNVCVFFVCGRHLSGGQKTASGICSLLPAYGARQAVTFTCLSIPSLISPPLPAQGEREFLRLLIFQQLSC